MSTRKTEAISPDAAALEEAAARLSPRVRAACDSTPSPAALAVIRAAAAREIWRRRQVMPFVRWSLATAAALALALAGWLVLKPAAPGPQLARDGNGLLDDLLFLCDQQEATSATPASDREALARRLLTLQGFDAQSLARPAAEEQPAPPTTESRSRSRHGLPAQRCV